MALSESENAVQTISNRYDLKQDDTAQWFSHVKWHSGFDKPQASLDTVVQYLEKLELISKDANPQTLWQAV